MIDVTDKKNVEKIMLYRRVFGTRDGLAVLEDMLNDLCFFTTIDTDEDRYLHNFAISLLLKTGTMQDFNQERISEMLLKVPYTPPIEGVGINGEAQ